MFFRNLLLYPVDPAALALDDESLQAALLAKRAKPCPPNTKVVFGFAPPVGRGENAQLFRKVQNCLLIKVRKEERLLPAGVLKDMVDEQIEEIEYEEQRKVNRKEREEITDSLGTALLPRAFVKRSETTAAIDLERGFIYINTGTFSAAEDVLALLREALGTLPPRSVNVRHSPSATMTSWVKTQEPGFGFTLGSTAELVSEDDGSIKLNECDLGSEEIAALINSGHTVSALSLNWEDKLTFNFNEKFQFKRLRFSDMLQSEVKHNAGDDRAADLDASLILMIDTFGDLLDSLFPALGGVDIGQSVIAEASASEQQEEQAE